MQRYYSLSLIYDFWDLIVDKEDKVSSYQRILIKYESKFEGEALETCRGAKMMLSKLMVFWKEDP